MSLVKKTYEIQGYTFTVLPTTIFNRKQLEAALREARDAILESGKIQQQLYEREKALLLSQEDPSIEIPPKPELSDHDEYDPLIVIFKTITEGPHDKLDWEHFDTKIAEDALENFQPSARRIALEVAGYLS